MKFANFEDAEFENSTPLSRSKASSLGLNFSGSVCTRQAAAEC